MNPIARFGAGAIVLGPLLILMAMLMAGSKPGSWISISLGGYLLLFLPIGLGMFWRASRQVQARRKVELGYCARCGYVLSGLPTATDGCIVCPECGAAWKLGSTP